MSSMEAIFLYLLGGFMLIGCGKPSPAPTQDSSSKRIDALNQEVVETTSQLVKTRKELKTVRNQSVTDKNEAEEKYRQLETARAEDEKRFHTEKTQLSDQVQSANETIAEIEAEQTRLRNEVKALETRFEESQKKNTGLTTQLQQLRGNLETKLQELATSQSALKTAQRDLATMERSQKTLLTKIRREKTDFMRSLIALSASKDSAAIRKAMYEHLFRTEIRPGNGELRSLMIYYPKDRDQQTWLTIADGKLYVILITEEKITHLAKTPFPAKDVQVKALLNESNKTHSVDFGTSGRPVYARSELFGGSRESLEEAVKEFIKGDKR